LVDLHMTIGRGTKPTVFLLAASLGGWALLAVSAAVAQTQQRNHAPRHRTVTVPQPQARIACTVLGCQPIPAACTPVPGRTLSGLPTGYDVIVCPPGIQPLR
jgi:hypothetical protein